MDFESKQISMEKVDVPPLHKHPLIPFTRFAFGRCEVYRLDGSSLSNIEDTCIYGGYRCNELGCQHVVFHKECAKPLPEINHSYHPDHSLKLIIQNSEEPSTCTLCMQKFRVGYCCSICDFKLDLKCVRRPEPLVLPGNSYGHEHPLELVREEQQKNCKVCDFSISRHYKKTGYLRWVPWQKHVEQSKSLSDFLCFVYQQQV